MHSRVLVGQAGRGCLQVAGNRGEGYLHGEEARKGELLLVWGQDGTGFNGGTPIK